MKLFGKKEKKACCAGNCSNETMQQAEALKKEAGIKVLGSGCAKCTTLEKSVCEALEQLGQHEEIDHITDFAQIAAYGVMTTPALVVDGKVVSYGKVLSAREAKEILKKSGRG
ncbi:thioredoxin family protein [uncultured Dubosiella sp.]|uniref:thioredoxin family protein n=1 Tax=uncultured Dubosiella sp. TaxID=1937011 RepID=UPI000ED0BA6A|nr:thioredoxin family protein [uncultured Dubosiella sp.]GJM56620.1 redox-active disulfide protein 2 [Erysipelotrichaceae bacterium OPF54]HAM31431.1 thioredoxin family protein [Erysipelotrichaceae bacterium]